MAENEVGLPKLPEGATLDAAGLRDGLPALPEGARLDSAPPAPPPPATWGEAALRGAQNIPSSAGEFAKNLVQPIIHPIETAQSLGNIGMGVLEHLGLLSGSEHEPYANAVGKFLLDRYGSIEGVKNTLANDPVGLAADLSMILTGGGGLAARAPGLAGRTAEIVGSAGRLVDPLTNAAKVAGKVAKVPGEIAAQTLGVSTFAGPEAIKTAARAGYEGGEKSRAFLEQLRGKGDMESVVNDARQSLDNLRQQRGIDYRAGMKNVGQDTTQLNFDKIDQALTNIANVKSYKGVSTSPSTQATRLALEEAVNKWRMLDPTDFHTAEGFDALKQMIGDVRDSTQFGSPERRVADQVYHAVRGSIIDQVPAYARVMKAYENASKRINEVSRALSLGDKASTDTALRKLQSVLRDNVNANYGNRRNLAEYLVQNGSPELLEKLAGQSLQPWTPRGLGKLALSVGAEVGAILGLGTGGAGIGAALAGAPLMSPRLVGEAAHAAGVGARYMGTLPLDIGLSAQQVGRLPREAVEGVRWPPLQGPIPAGTDEQQPISPGPRNQQMRGGAVEEEDEARHTRMSGGRLRRQEGGAASYNELLADAQGALKSPGVGEASPRREPPTAPTFTGDMKYLLGGDTSGKPTAVARAIREPIESVGTSLKNIMNGGYYPGLRREDVTDIPPPAGPTKDSTLVGRALGVAPQAWEPNRDYIGDVANVAAAVMSGAPASAVEGAAGMAGGKLGRESYEQLLSRQRGVEGLRAAMRDPQTGKVYTGYSHQAAIESVPKSDTTGAWGRLSSEWDRETPNTGFIDRSGNFISRDEAEKRFGVSTMEDIRDLRKGTTLGSGATDERGRALASGLEAAAGANAPPFYSAVERAVSESPQASAPGWQWLGMLRNKPGVKPEELEWTGLQDWLQSKGPKTPVTREELNDFLASNRVEMREVTKRSPHNYPYEGTAGSPKFSRYQLPGGENYREMLFTMPPKRESLDISQFEPFYGGGVGMWEGRTPVNGVTEAHFSIGDQSGRITHWPITYDWKDRPGPAKWIVNSPNLRNGHFDSLGAAKAAIESSFNNEAGTAGNYMAKSRGDLYKSSHWDEPNVLAHVRFNDRDINGKRTLFVEEVQSDWHQAGRKKGYGLNENDYNRQIDELKKRYAENTQAMAAESDPVKYAQLNNERLALTDEFNALHDRKRYGVPNAPLKSDWPSMVMKRMIRYASDNGYDQIAWTSGATQAGRYDLSKQVSAIRANKNSNGTFQLGIQPIGRNMQRYQTEVPADKLADHVGKELAEKIMKEVTTPGVDNGKVFGGLDLQVGGEGMKAFYDRELPQRVNKIVKKFGTKTQSGLLRVPKTIGEAGGEGGLEEMLSNAAKSEPMKTESVHVLPLTPELKGVAQREGFSLFARGGRAMARGARGAKGVR